MGQYQPGLRGKVRHTSSATAQILTNAGQVAGNSDNSRAWQGGAPAPQRTIVYLHGLGASYQAIENHRWPFGGFIGDLRSVFGTANVIVLGQYQDAGYEVGGQCGGPDPDQTAIEPLFVNSHGNAFNSPPVCDSNGPLALSATKLDNDLNTPSVVPPSGPITIVANSMGAAIARGWLDLDKNRLGHTADDRVDSIIFVQGSQSGVWLLPGPSAHVFAATGLTPFVAPIAAELNRFMVTVFGVDLGRPGAQDLAPQSKWYRAANPPGVPGSINYFNFYSDININFEARYLFWSQQVGSINLGDGVILPGSDDPKDLSHSGGGARFLPFGPQTGQHQYSMAGNVKFELDADLCALFGSRICAISVGARFGQALKDLVNAPVGHGGLTGMTVNGLNIDRPSQDHMGTGMVRITSCAPGGQQLTPEAEIIRILRDPANACG